jgi:hypothetical protein
MPTAHDPVAWPGNRAISDIVSRSRSNPNIARAEFLIGENAAASAEFAREEPRS